MAKRMALVDADALIYLAGFASQKTVYEVVLEKGDDFYQEFFPSATALKEHLAETGSTVIEKEAVVVPDPVEFALAIAKNKLVEMRDRYKNLELYVRGQGNWRDKVATIHGYKANRKAPKPYHYEAIIDYLVHQWNAVRIDGKEADDQIATRAKDLAVPPVICSVDKDLDQIPGLHWNYSKNVEYWITPQEAEDFFWTQVLAGDYADNVHGCWKLGFDGAQRIVEREREYWDRHNTDGSFAEHIWPIVVSCYENSMGRDGCPYAGMPAETVALENARLVWMQDEPGKLWTPPGYPEEYIEGGWDE